jgi:serine/threonine protein kinase
MAPKIHQSEPYGRPADLWSVRCTAYKLATRQPAFSGTSEFALRREVVSGPTPSIPPTPIVLTGLVASMLRKNPAARPTTAQLLQHHHKHPMMKKGTK